MRVPARLVAPTLPLFTSVLRAQSTNASLAGRVTDLSKATVAEAKVAAMNTSTNFHYEAATSSSGVPFAFSQRYPCSKVSMSDISSKLWRNRMRGEVVSDRSSDEEESRVDFVFSSLRERIGSSLSSSGHVCTKRGNNAET
jgi:hypothetical protein